VGVNDPRAMSVSDWRLTNQESYLKDVELTLQEFSRMRILTMSIVLSVGKNSILAIRKVTPHLTDITGYAKSVAVTLNQSLVGVFRLISKSRLALRWDANTAARFRRRCCER